MIFCAGTHSIDAFSYTLPSNRRIHLIDTPGFDDTNRTDIETLSVLAAYLGASYANGVRIHGIIVLHPIADNRMGGSSVRNIEMMKKLCGFDSYENVAVATTMWPPFGTGAGSSVERRILEKRETELLVDQRFMGELVANGAGMFRHNESGNNDAAEQMRSTRRIVSSLIAKLDTTSSPIKPLLLQRELIDEGKTLGETAAGIAIAGDLYKARREHKRQLQNLETELKSQLAKANASHTAQLQELKTDIQRKLADVEEEKRALRKSIKELHFEEQKAWEEKIRELDRQFHRRIAEKELELEELEESVREIQEEARLSRRSSQTEKEVTEHDTIVSSARKDVAEAQNAHKQFRGQTGNIINGLTNGIAAGAATSIIAGGRQAALFMS